MSVQSLSMSYSAKNEKRMARPGRGQQPRGRCFEAAAPWPGRRARYINHGGSDSGWLGWPRGCGGALSCRAVGAPWAAHGYSRCTAPPHRAGSHGQGQGPPRQDARRLDGRRLPRRSPLEAWVNPSEAPLRPATPHHSPRRTGHPPHKHHLGNVIPAEPRAAAAGPEQAKASRHHESVDWGGPDSPRGALITVRGLHPVNTPLFVMQIAHDGSRGGKGRLQPRPAPPADID